MEYLLNTREVSRDLVWPASPSDADKEYPDLTGKVYIVTGGTSGIGYESARLLLAQNATVYITGRTPEKITKTLETFKHDFPNARVELLKLANEDLSSIKPGVEEFLAKESRLDGILHNAGINYRGQNFTEIGVLDIITINVVAPQLLTVLLEPLLKKTASDSPANTVRVVWVSSAIHYHSPPYGGIEWDHMNEFDAGSYLGNGNGMYGQTKAMNIYQAVQWAKHLEGTGIISVAVHPGTLYSDIRRGNKWRKMVMESFAKPSIWGAWAELWPLLNPGVTTEQNGAYYIPFGQVARVRPDVREAAEGPRGSKFWSWVNDLIKPYE